MGLNRQHCLNLTEQSKNLVSLSSILTHGITDVFQQDPSKHFETDHFDDEC